MAQYEKISMLPYKRCSHCKQLKELSSFYKNRSRKGGLSCYCKSCHDKESCKRRIEYKKAHRQHYTELEGERRRRIQDEAGCHSKVEDFYPGYRLIKALENAEVIEI